MNYKVTKDHKVKSISSSVYTIKKDTIIEGVEQSNGYIRFKCLGMEMYIPKDKIVIE